MSSRFNKPVKTGKKQVRNPDGTFPRGVSGNPNGRPRGTQNFTTLVREALAQVAKKQGRGKKTYEELLIEQIMQKAIHEGNPAMIRLVWNYLDGMPQQVHDSNVSFKDETERMSLEEIEEQMGDLIFEVAETLLEHGIVEAEALKGVKREEVLPDLKGLAKRRTSRRMSRSR